MGLKRQTILIQKVVSTANLLSKKASIPTVSNKMERIKEIQHKPFWEAATIPDIEQVRIELRDLVKFLDMDAAPIYFTTFEDQFDGVATEHRVIFNFNDLAAYRQKVEFYLKDNRTHLTIHKLRNNIQITSQEFQELENMLFEQGALGTKEEFIKAYGEQPIGKFIRGILGLDVNAAKTAFGEILTRQTLNSQQIRFMDTLINFFSVKGVISADMLFNPPFTDIDTSGITGVFDTQTATKIISLIEEINLKAETG